MNTKASVYLGAIALCALALPLTLSLSNAQEGAKQPAVDQQQPPPGGPGGPPGGFQPGPGQPGQGFNGQPGFRPMGGGGGGGATMVADGAYLYILQGNRLTKVSKEDLKVARTAELPMPQPQGNFGGPGGPGGVGAPGGGRGGNPPGGGGGGGDETSTK